MKKIISFTLALFMMIFAIPTVNAVEATPKFIVKNVSGNYGDIVNVKINIENNPGITALQLKINYSSKDLELMSIEDGNLFGNAITHGQLTKTPFIISWYSQSSDDKVENGTLATLKFRILDGASTSNISIIYDEDNVFDSGFNNVYFDTVVGKVDVNNDEIVLDNDIYTLKDVVCTLKYIISSIELTESQIANADVNNDSEITVVDVLLMQKIILG